MKYLILIFCFPIFIFAQDDLLDEIDTDSIGSQKVSAAFKGLKIVNFESTKLVAKNELTLIVSHRFGSLKNGISTFFGLDDAVTRIHFVYGLSEHVNIGVSRSSYSKTYQASLKYRLLRQEKGKSPFTIVGYNAISVNTGLSEDFLPLLEFKDRLGYTTQLLISRKVNTNLSLELAPTFFHDNFVALDSQDNSQYGLGVGGRYKLTKRLSFNMDYGIHFNRADDSPYKNPLSIGFDVETGGHVFQMHFSNSQPMYTNGFFGQANGDWGDGRIFFGFNLSRRF